MIPEEMNRTSCRFSIITVCRNAEEQIEKTIHSVFDQSDRNYEYIIKDGESTDETVLKVRQLARYDIPQGITLELLEGKDAGIYYAMNIAVKDAHGEYVLFLNAGDVFSDRDILLKVSERIEQDEIRGEAADIYFGDIREVENSKGKTEITGIRKYTAKNAKLKYYSLGACLNHQSMFCRRELFEERLFDLSYRICADREWQLYHIRNGAIASPLGFPVADILTEGFSSENIPLLEEETERCVKEYCGAWYGLYHFLSVIKKNPFLHKLLYRAERFGSVKEEKKKRTIS